MELLQLKGIGEKTKELYKKLNINNLEDLISFYPYRYELIKRSNVQLLKQDDKIIIDGKIESLPNLIFFHKKRNKMTFRLNIGSLLLNVIIFNRAFLKQQLTINKMITVIGKYDKLKNTIIASEIRDGKLPDYEVIEPVYRLTYGLTQKKIKSNLIDALQVCTSPNKLPSNIMDKYNFLDKKSSLLEIHHPTSKSRLEQAINMLKYEEIFYFMFQINQMKLGLKKEIGIKRKMDFNKVLDFIKTLPFELTKDQLRVIEEIYNDLLKDKKMNRLLQGDVGSGKTIVAVIGMYINYLSSYMSALMAPTEVLANQHYKNIKEYFKEFNLRVVLLTGKTRKKEREEIITLIKEQKIDILIGTHALFTEDIHYHNLGFIVIDEQQRFGVQQRRMLKDKGQTADILYMSATPIPRTYALALYGDMDISAIKTMPSGRIEVTTILKKDNEILDVLKLMHEQLKKKRQIYVVVPLILESDTLDMEWVEKIEEQLKMAFGKYYKIKSLHGKMDSETKEKIMMEFHLNKIQILISTTVIEVGIDVKNATMIVIYDSYRFGLSTLHQLRGRVGRSNYESYCILISSKETKRLEILTKTNDGFLISEHDFKLRGSGDLFGIRQSGDLNFSLADIKEDYQLFLRAKEESLLYLCQKK